MATSLKITSTDANSNEVNTNISYINESCADSDLKLFATHLFDLSDNTINAVTKITSTDITNVQPEPTGAYALWTPSAEFYDINNTSFMNALINGYKSPPEEENIIAINSATVTNSTTITFNVTYENGTTKDVNKADTHVFFGGASKLSFTQTNGSIYWRTFYPNNLDFSDLARFLNVSLQDIADMIMQNKFVQVFAQGLQGLNEETITSSRSKRVNISYVPETNSIRIDPVEGVTDNFLLQLTDAGALSIYDEEEGYLPDPAYSEGQSLGLNTKIILDEDNSIYINMGISENI